MLLCTMYICIYVGCRFLGCDLNTALLFFQFMNDLMKTTLKPIDTVMINYHHSSCLKVMLCYRKMHNPLHCNFSHHQLFIRK